METNKRYSGIDGLRTVGCLGIILMHINANTDYLVNSFFYNAVIPLFTEFVYLFMLISAFGMCCGYYQKLKDGTFDPNRFYQRRYGKLWVFFALVVLLEVVVERTPQTLAEAFIELTMVFGLLPNNELGVVGVAWTLGVIFVFYYLFPYFVFLLWNKRRAWFATIVSLIISILCQQYFCTGDFVVENFSVRHSFLYCTPFFLVGGLIYLYREELCRFVQRWRIPSLLVCIASVFLYFGIPATYMGVSLFVVRQLVGFVPWMIYAISIDTPVLSNPVTKYLSGISMEMYLAHMVIFRVVEKLGLAYIFGRSIWSYVATCLLTFTGLLVSVQLYRLAYTKVTAYIQSKKTTAK